MTNKVILIARSLVAKLASRSSEPLRPCAPSWPGALGSATCRDVRPVLKAPSTQLLHTHMLARWPFSHFLNLPFIVFLSAGTWGSQNHSHILSAKMAAAWPR